MHKTVLTLIPILVAAVASPALAGTVQFPIINGEQIDDDEFESAAALIASFTMDFMGTPMDTTAVSCTGSLIAPDVVLTAGHCVDEAALGMGMFEVTNLEFCVSFESDLAYMVAQEHEGNPPLPDDAVCATGFVQHPDFDMDNMNEVDGPEQFDDLALIFLEDEITDRDFAWLPTEAEAEGIVDDLDVDIVGYGQRDPEATMFDTTEPLRYWAATFINEVGSHEMQIGDSGDDGRKCHGDSGGPTYAEIGLGPDSERMIGVTSHAYNMTDDCDIGGVDTRVDPYLDWIDDEMSAACDEGLRTACDPPGIRWAEVVQEEPPEEEGAGCNDCDSNEDDATPAMGISLGFLVLFVCRRRW
jgi:hypothetical protein